jgi:hypothetical protein
MNVSDVKHKLCNGTIRVAAFDLNEALVELAKQHTLLYQQKVELMIENNDLREKLTILQSKTND